MSEKICIAETNKETDIIHKLMSCKPITNLTNGFIQLLKY